MNNADANLAALLLDRLDVSPDDDARVDQITEIVRGLAADRSAQAADIARLSAALAEKSAQLEEERARNAAIAKDVGKMVHNMVVAQQAAWIEWQHGGGAEAAMGWIENGLVGPGHIPEDSEPYGTEAQAYFDANRADAYPACFCGRPSNQLWMGRGFCSEAHYRQRRAELDAAPPLAITPGDAS